MTVATIPEIATLPIATAGEGRSFRVGLLWFVAALLALSAVYIGLRTYQQVYGLSAGLDSTDPLFRQYWMPLLWGELIVLFGLAVGVQLYLIATRDRDIEAVAPDVELRRYFYLTMWMALYAFTFYWAGSFFAEGDGNWHQTVLRDTPLTPSHIVLFYAGIPLYLLFGVGSFVYGVTRIPAFCRGISLMHVFAVLGPALILPNLGFNEWGHAYWLTEEIISHPLHWGFVVLSWNALAMGGVLLQMASRLRELIPVVFAAEAVVS